jgi:pyruvate/2-oxoglutarate dehydrogenase complex dihydrolipoamide acyltransferase (E2) component
MEEAALVCWKFAPAQMIKKDEIVPVIETDKVAFEMPSPGDGLLHPITPPGTRVVVGQVVGYLAADKSELEKLAARYPAAKTETPEEPSPAPEIQKAGTGAGKETAAPELEGRIIASPVARAMAKTHGLDISRIRGTGPGGRLDHRDFRL